VAEDLNALQRIQQLFGVRSTGLSGQTTRALREHGEIAPAMAPQPIEAAPEPVQIGPQPSQELLDRVKAEQERRSAESFKRIMDQRNRELTR
jgi:hypothetical protein